jgi:hypothetical protein
MALSDRGAVRMSTCHPDKVAAVKTGALAGLCVACYHKRRRERLAAGAAPLGADPAGAALGALDLARAAAAAHQEAGRPVPKTLAESLALAEQDLIDCLPLATAAVRATLQTPPDQGLALKAAESLLRGYVIPTGDGTRRLYEPPTRAVAASASAQVVIGLQVVGAPGAAPSTIVGQVVRVGAAVAAPGVDPEAAAEGRGAKTLARAPR